MNKTFDASQVKPSQQVKSRVKVSTEVMAECPKREALPDKYTFADLLLNRQDLGDKLETCDMLNTAKGQVIDELLKQYQPPEKK